MALTQSEVDALVARIRSLIAKHGPDSEKMERVRALYTLFHDCPEAGSFTFLKLEVEKLEKDA